MKLNHPRNLSPVFILNVLAAAEYSDDLQAFAEYIWNSAIKTATDRITNNICQGDQYGGRSALCPYREDHIRHLRELLVGIN